VLRLNIIIKKRLGFGRLTPEESFEEKNRIFNVSVLTREIVKIVQELGFSLPPPPRRIFLEFLFSSLFSL
jgi:hypothetical protein